MQVQLIIKQFEETNCVTQILSDALETRFLASWNILQQSKYSNNSPTE